MTSKRVGIRRPKTTGWRFRLEASEWGLPDRLFVDRDSVFYDNGSKSPFPTRFHLWLQALVVDLIIGPAHRPQKRSITEHIHQARDGQVLKGQRFAVWEQLRWALEQRRDFVNEHLPCASLDERPPLVACPQARTLRHVYRPEWQAELRNLDRAYAYLAEAT